jgi:hypothetical protein
MFWLGLLATIGVVLAAAALYDRRRKGHMAGRDAHRGTGGLESIRFPQDNGGGQ